MRQERSRGGGEPPNDRLRRVGWLVLLLLLASGAPAGLPLAEPSPAAAPLLFWEVRRSFSEAPHAFLLGSVALPATGMLRFDSAIEEGYAASARVVLPTDQAQLPLLEQIEIWISKATLPEGGTRDIRAEIGAPTYARLEKLYSRRGIDLAASAGLRTAFLGAQLVIADLRQLGYARPIEFELYFAERARGRKDIVAIEPMAQSLEHWRALPDESQLGILKVTLYGSERAEERVSSLARAWASGDVEQVERQVAETLRAHPELEPVHEVLRFEPARRAADAIEALFEQAPTAFVILPAELLVGERGVLAKLRGRGFVIIQRTSRGASDGAGS